MKSLKDVKTSSTYKKILLIGDSGSGKSTFIGTFPKPLVCDFDNKGEDVLAGVDGYIESYQGVEGWDQFRKDLAKWTKEGLPEGCLTLAIDSLTFAADAALAWVKKANNNASPLAQRADWGRAIDEIKSVLGKLVGAPFHCVVSVHLSVETDELIGGVVWQPSIYGSKLPMQIPAYFNDVWHTKVELKGGVPSFKLQLSPDQRLKFLKNSGRGTWSALEEPSFAKLLLKL